LFLGLVVGCRKGDAIATLERTHGAVSRDFAKGVGSWEAAATGAQFRLGDGVRSGRCTLGDVCGGSRGRAYAASGDPLAEDPLCEAPV
jgi:MoaA/NifB/PqqE/SkfB family radical SAM enzyme